jgi:hypothetical protein
MNTQTLTTTASTPSQNNETMVLRLKRQTESALERLASIVEGVGQDMYKKYKDPLSFHLMEWSAKVMAVDLTEEVLGLGYFREEVKANLNVLMTAILVDVVANSSLKEPMLITETGWTCEKQFIEWTQLAQTTYKGKPITFISHEFALKMIEWASSISEEESDNSTTSSGESMPNTSANAQLIKLASENPQDPEWQSCMRSFLMTYKMKFQQMMAMFKLNQFIQEVYKESELLESLMVLIDQRSKERMQKAQEQAEKDHKVLEQRIDNMEKTTAEKVEILQTSNAEMRQKVEKAEAEVIQAKLKSIDQEAEIRSLHHAYACRLREIQALRESASSGGSRCTIL